MSEVVKKHQVFTVSKCRLSLNKVNNNNRLLKDSKFRNQWTKKVLYIYTQEDDAVIYLIQKLKSKDWSLIAQILKQEYGIFNRTGKQIRER